MKFNSRIICILVILSISLFGCTTKQYIAKETGKEISKELTDVIQIGLICKETYDIIKVWKSGLCDINAISQENCEKIDRYLTAFNGALTIYGTVSVNWYKIESNPNLSDRITKKEAGILIWALWKERDTLLAASKGIVGDKINLPELKVLSAILNKYPNIENK